MTFNKYPVTPGYVPRPEKPIVALKPNPWSVLLKLQKIGSILLILPLVTISWEYLQLLRTKYMFTTRRFRIISGVFDELIDEVWLFRVTDIRLRKPFLYRLVGLANLDIYSTDKNNKYVEIKAIPITDALKLLETLQQHINIERQINRPDIPGAWF